MGRFDPHLGLYCQNDEVSTVCAPVFMTSDLPLVDLSEVILDPVLGVPSS